MLMLVCISSLPGPHAEYTRQTLDFAERAARVRVQGKAHTAGWATIPMLSEPLPDDDEPEALESPREMSHTAGESESPQSTPARPQPQEPWAATEPTAASSPTTQAPLSQVRVSRKGGLPVGGHWSLDQALSDINSQDYSSARGSRCVQTATCSITVVQRVDIPNSVYCIFF